MRLIDKQYALASAVSGIVRTDENGENWIRTRDVRESIMNVPTIEAEPVKYAKPVVYYHGENTFSYDCGICHMPIDKKDCYCRWCGAKMDQEV